ncbi:hypothetical protein NPIL_648191 [Nephila pilipes]|uniref:Uncharacterized protein n=1 Tax=Nephila pilipes TaxID=299642 RepID=A0A8X6TS36_NEPPI|nr:hypothetical protein NPIL_648191 [Nephila pilipes]
MIKWTPLKVRENVTGGEYILRRSFAFSIVLNAIRIIRKLNTINAVVHVVWSSKLLPPWILSSLRLLNSYLATNMEKQKRSICEHDNILLHPLSLGEPS